MVDARQQPRLIFQIGSGEADFEGRLVMRGDFSGGKAFGRGEQLFSRLGHQLERRRDGDIGNQMRCVFQALAIFDQAGRACLAQDFLKDFGKALSPKPRPKL